MFNLQAKHSNLLPNSIIKNFGEQRGGGQLPLSLPSRTLNIRNSTFD